MIFHNKYIKRCISKVISVCIIVVSISTLSLYSPTIYANESASSTTESISPTSESISSIVEPSPSPVSASQDASDTQPLDISWPQAPSITSETAVLIEATTGTILYDKSMHQKMYPASITKTLTTLVAMDELDDLTELVTFDMETLNTIPYDSSRIWVDDGEKLTVEQCIAAILIASANDVSAGLGKHIAGTLEAFAEKMNEKATELGCLNSHFVNAHGYHDPDHYTTAYDMAQIGRAFFKNEFLSTYAKERVLHIEPSQYQPDDIWEHNKNKLLETRTYEYEYLVGTKTGYTSDAGQTLISGAMKDGMLLICVVLNAKTPNQYTDTVSLFDYGFQNFKIEELKDNASNYIPDSNTLGENMSTILGDSSPLLELEKDSYVLLPKNATFQNLTSEMIYNPTQDDIATVEFKFADKLVGTTKIKINKSTSVPAEDLGVLEEPEIVETAVFEENDGLPINFNFVIFVVVALFIGYFLVRLLATQIDNYLQAKNPARISNKKRLFSKLHRNTDSKPYTKTLAHKRRPPAPTHRKPSSTRESASSSRNNTSSSRNNASLSRNNASSSRENASLSRNNASSSRNNASLSRNNASSSRNNASSSSRRTIPIIKGTSTDYKTGVRNKSAEKPISPTVKMETSTISISDRDTIEEILKKIKNPDDL